MCNWLVAAVLHYSPNRYALELNASVETQTCLSLSIPHMLCGSRTLGQCEAEIRFLTHDSSRQRTLPTTGPTTSSAALEFPYCGKVQAMALHQTTSC
mmetsp:Transcript_10207/g.11865  ORF Transcript_10207/g.11865 Transcript_10207/m.11865 type:complete len:97 (-) Transcript_10207:72-362(-)